MKPYRIEWFMIWAVLGFSAGVMGLAYLVLSTFLFGHSFYEHHPWLFVIGLGIVGIVLWSVGLSRSRKEASQANPGRADHEPPASAEARWSLFLSSAEYWGSMFLLVSLLLAICCSRSWRGGPPPPPGRLPKKVQKPALDIQSPALESEPAETHVPAPMSRTKSSFG